MMMMDSKLKPLVKDGDWTRLADVVATKFFSGFPLKRLTAA